MNNSLQLVCSVYDVTLRMDHDVCVMWHMTLDLELDVCVCVCGAWRAHQWWEAPRRGRGCTHTHTRLHQIEQPWVVSDLVPYLVSQI